MRGVYALVIELETPSTRKVGGLGDVEFSDGAWIYIGSAMGRGSTSLENRISRHFNNRKKNHWHIDHLLDTSASLISAVWAQSETSMECKVVQGLKKRTSFASGPKGFGATDCHENCGTHLYFYGGSENVEELLTATMENLGLNPVISRNPESLLQGEGSSPINKD
ncbi:MAG: GIY-YIG nuclease family protein [Candidatus Thorarchaeota archaeon]|nr:GIY-YIG nuclease family protein [Candidatus Thorarchaeota archaeon]